MNDNDKNNTYFIYHIHSYTIVSNFSNPITPLVDKINPKCFVTPINLYTRSDNLIIHSPHIDYEYEHTCYFLCKYK